MRIDTDLNGGVVPVRLSLRLSPLSLLPLPIVLAPLAESWGLAVHERGPVTFRSCFLKGVEGGLGRSCRTLFLCGGEFRRHSHRSQHASQSMSGSSSRSAARNSGLVAGWPASI